MIGNAAEYDLVAAGSLEEALTHVAAGRRPIAGGTDLMVLFEAGNLPFRELVDIRIIPAMCNIEVTAEHLDIGAAVTYSAIRNHPVLKREFGLLTQAASWTGGVANQNRGTLGGNIVNASPAADSPPALLVYDAEVELTSLRGARWQKYERFHTGYKTMRMEPDELLTRIRCPRPQGDWIEYGRKVGARKAQAISKLAISAIARDDISEVRIAMASVAPVPLRCRATENVLTGAVLNSETIQRAREVLKSELSPISDIRSTADYRRHVAANLLSEFIDLLRQPRPVLDAWNELDVTAALDRIEKCCGSRLWATSMVAQRPFHSTADLFKEADELWANLGVHDKLEAFRSHPKIGDRVAPSEGWAQGEQSGMIEASHSLRDAMLEANVEYKSKFGFIYIVCATGKTAEEMLGILQRRLGNDRESELAEASEQHRQIMRLRLRKWLAQ